MVANHHGHHHDGHPRPGGREGGARRRRVLLIVLVANAAVLVAETAGGIASGSLALLADAAHVLSDVGGLGVALAAERLAVRPPSRRHSYGLQRAEVLGAVVNAVLSGAAAGAIAVAAFGRLDTATAVDGAVAAPIALGGLAVNVVSAVALARAAGASLGMRGAVVHMAADAAGSVVAVVAAVLAGSGVAAADPVASLAIGALVLWAAARLLLDAAHVLLEGTPAGLDPDDIARAVAGVDGVVDVHHLHVWSLASDAPALSAHVVLDSDPALHDAQVVGDGIRSMLEQRFGIGHATLALECHDCEAADC